MTDDQREDLQAMIANLELLSLALARHPVPQHRYHAARSRQGSPRKPEASEPVRGYPIEPRRPQRVNGGRLAALRIFYSGGCDGRGSTSARVRGLIGWLRPSGQVTQPGRLVTWQNLTQRANQDRIRNASLVVPKSGIGRRTDARSGLLSAFGELQVIYYLRFMEASGQRKGLASLEARPS